MKGSLEAHEFGKHNITVNAYAPGMTDTQMSQSFLLLSIVSVLG
jgi:NAD(P)-dependent dehydrogenase (short-subunit alcohol dehydrogenase family)